MIKEQIEDYFENLNEKNYRKLEVNARGFKGQLENKEQKNKQKMILKVRKLN